MMEHGEPVDLQCTRTLAVVWLLVCAVHALTVGLLIYPVLGFYFAPLFIVGWRLWALRRWALCASTLISGAVAAVAGRPVLMGKLTAGWYVSPGPLYLVVALCFFVPLGLTVRYSWPNFKSGL
jgi:hypothetical protein